MKGQHSFENHLIFFSGAYTGQNMTDDLVECTKLVGSRDVMESDVSRME